MIDQALPVGRKTGIQHDAAGVGRGCPQKGMITMMTRRNPYKIVKYDSGVYGVEYIDHPGVGFPESWGSRRHATAYMAALLGLTYEEYRKSYYGKA